MNICKILKNILAPKKCYSCKKEGHFICDECSFKLPLYESNCFICKQISKKYQIHNNCINSEIYYDKIIIKYHYKSYFISKMIKDGKFYNKKDVLESFGESLAKHLNNNLEIINDAVLIPVPLHFLRKIKRGYNQSEILAKSISRHTGIGYHNSVISRKKYTRQQSKLSKNKRIDNIKNSFNIRSKYVDIIDKKQIIIIDDVISTGSTINEIAKILKENGASQVIGLCIASD